MQRAFSIPKATFVDQSQPIMGCRQDHHYNATLAPQVNVAKDNSILGDASENHKGDNLMKGKW